MSAFSAFRRIFRRSRRSREDPGHLETVPGSRERDEPGTGAGWMPSGQTREGSTALGVLSRGSPCPAPEGCESPQAAQQLPSPGDSLPRAGPVPALSLSLRSPFSPTGSPPMQCSLGAGSTAPPMPTPHGLSSSPTLQRPPSQPQLAWRGEEEEEGHPPAPSEVWEVQLPETDSDSDSSSSEDLCPAEEGRGQILMNVLEESSEELRDLKKQIRDLELKPSSSRLWEQEHLFQGLIFFTASPRAEERQEALVLIARALGSGISPSSARCLGELVARLIFCCASSIWKISSVAADALQHLFDVLHRERWGGSEQGPRVFSFLYSSPDWKSEEDEMDTSGLVREFGIYLWAEERTGLVLTAIAALGDSSTQDSQVACILLDVATSDPGFWLVDAEEILRGIHSTLQRVPKMTAQQSLESLLWLLAERSPEDTVRTLLKISPECDRAALAMWEAMLSPARNTQKIFEGLLDVMEGSITDISVSAASQVLCTVSQWPHCQESLGVLFPKLFMALISQLVQDPRIPGDEKQVALKATKSLLCATGCEELVQTIQQEGGWDLLLGSEALQRGVSMLARELRSKSSAEQRCSLFQNARRSFGSGEHWQSTLALTFYVELLGCRDIEKTSGDLHHLHQYLESYSHTMQMLALKGLAALSGDPQMAAEMRSEALLGSILERATRGHSDVKVEALLLFRALLVRQLEEKEASHMAVMAAESLPPLFDDESSQVRELSIILFRELLVVMVRKDKKEVEELVRRTLISLFLRMSDESVAEASGRALLTSAKFLGWKKLKRAMKNQETWRVGEILLEQERSWVEEYVSFSKIRLRAAPTGVRLAAIRFIGEQQPPGTLSWLPRAGGCAVLGRGRSDGSSVHRGCCVAPEEASEQSAGNVLCPPAPGKRPGALSPVPGSSDITGLGNSADEEKKMRTESPGSVLLSLASRGHLPNEQGTAAAWD
ncbi:maestro heat-like repeat-containing protein family member 7 isoform X2 [Heliangelus exortis]|uniref:maestro heat-like repeat-containing protein family member 7 isoform X2 n=1 Tax=Heliangelus exortis TaxID=472823 RepID=UPI003A91E443